MNIFKKMFAVLNAIIIALSLGTVVSVEARHDNDQRQEQGGCHHKRHRLMSLRGHCNKDRCRERRHREGNGCNKKRCNRRQAGSQESVAVSEDHGVHRVGRVLPGHGRRVERRAERREDRYGRRDKRRENRRSRRDVRQEARQEASSSVE